MREEDILKERYGTDPGFRVPEGYFEKLHGEIMDKLPAYPEVERKVELSLWQRLKPYVYLAAMFVGIWLMMNVFHRVSGYGAFSLDNIPETVAVAMASGDDYSLQQMETNDYELMNEIAANYDNFDEFESDFGYELKPQYASMEVSASSPATVDI